MNLSTAIFAAQRIRALFVILLTSLVLAAPAIAAGGGSKGGAPATLASKDYDYYLTGSAVDVIPAARASVPMVVLMGGGLDVDEAFRLLIAKGAGSSGGKVDVVVIRASGADGYNDYLYQMGGADSVETLVVKTRAGADSANVNRIVAGADVIFIAGGDQWSYISLWRGTALDATLRSLVQQRIPIGGTSAGLAVLGQFDFSAQFGTITSATAMANPYDSRLALDRTFLDTVPFLAATIADPHLVTRDRMGRLVAFLARIVKDGWVGRPEDARGIGVDEETAVIVDNGSARIVGKGAAYFIQPTIAATTIQPRVPLTIRNLRVDKLSASAVTFDVANWTRSDGGAPYWLAVENGILYSSGSGGAVY